MIGMIKVKRGSMQIYVVAFTVILSIIVKALSTTAVLLVDMLYVFFVLFLQTINENSISMVKYIHRFRFLILSLLITLIMTILFTMMRENAIDSLWGVRILLYCFFYHSLGYCFGIKNKVDNVDKLLRIFTNILLVTAIYGWIEYFTKTNIFEDYFYINYSKNKYLFQSVSFFVHPIPFACNMTMGFWLNNYVNRNRSLLKYVFAITFIGAIIFSQARSSWLALIITGALYFLADVFNKGGLRKIIKILVILSFALVVFMYLLESNETISIIYEGIILRLNSIQGSNSETQRLGAIIFIFEKVTEAAPWNVLFGHGFGSSSEVMLSTTISISNFSAVDNQYLTILYDCGILVFGGLIITILGFIKVINVRVWNNKRLVNVTFAILSYCITGFFFESIWWLNVTGLGFILIGLWYSEFNRTKIINIIEE